MSEEATSSATEAGSPVSSGATENWEGSPIAQVYHPDGTLRANAGDSLRELGHEDLAGFATRNDQSFFDALKNGKEARAGLSQRQESIDNTVVKPGEGATPEDLAAYREGLGALPSADAYKEALIPKDLPEGVEIDEGLASLVSEWATKHPVNTPEAMQELFKSHSELMDGMIESNQQSAEHEFNKQREETHKLLTAELGGEEVKSKFDEDLGKFLMSEQGRNMGFEYEVSENGEIVTSNHLHAAMMNDPAFLRVMRQAVALNNPQSLPGGRVAPTDIKGMQERKRELIMSSSGGWKSESDHQEYKSISDQLRAYGQ
tara:strand:- start:546 stop:1496 length:951 start_codon:yes stop_codon:yes gene_type:complete